MYKNKLYNQANQQQKMRTTTQIAVIYKNNISEFFKLARIRGEPTISFLITLKNEIKANTQTVNRTLGGGTKRHLGLF